MKTYHRSVTEFESLANAETKRREVVEKLETAEREFYDAEADKPPLLKQRDKVRTSVLNFLGEAPLEVLNFESYFISIQKLV
jgi:hypothetical protein